MNQKKNEAKVEQKSSLDKLLELLPKMTEEELAKVYKLATYIYVKG